MKILALTDEVRTLYEFVFAVPREQKTRADFVTVKFAVAGPRWRNCSAPPNIITGWCKSGELDSSNTLHLSVYSMYLQHSFHTEVDGCTRCCDPAAQSQMHAYIDAVQGKLVLVCAGMLSTVDLESSEFYHTSYKFNTGRERVTASANTVLGNFTVVQTHVRPRMVFPTNMSMHYPLHVFVLAISTVDGPREQQTDTAATQRMAFGVVTVDVTITDTPDGAMYIEYLRIDALESEVRRQLARDHFSASHVLTGRFDLHAESFVMLNNWDYNISERVQPLPATLYVVFACTVWHTPGEEGLGMRLFVHVAIDTSNAHANTISIQDANTTTESISFLTITVLGAMHIPVDRSFAYMAAALAPLNALAEHPSVLAAQSLLVIVDVVGGGGGVHVESMALKCTGCSGSYGREYNMQRQTCGCPHGAVSVCVPCANTMKYSLQKFTFDATSMQKQSCLVRPDTSARPGALYYEICVKCPMYSRMYCPDNAMPKECPIDTHRTNVEGATSVQSCSCGHGYARTGTKAVVRAGDGQAIFNACPLGPGNCDIACARCNVTDNILCNALLPDNFKVVVCPPNTQAKHRFIKQNGNFVTLVQQECVCAPGFRRERTTASYHSPSELLDANIYTAKWNAKDARIFETYNYSVVVSACSACREGYFCAGLGKETQCDSNSVSSTNGVGCQCISGWYGWTEGRGCSECPRDHVCVDGDKHSCTTHESHPSCPCMQKGQYWHENNIACESCPVGYYCPTYDISQPHTHDAYAINRALACPSHSQTSAGGNSAVVSCICRERLGLSYYMSVVDGVGECVVCPAGFYCPTNTRIACPDNMHTTSPTGSSRISACACIDRARELSYAASSDSLDILGGVCVCKDGAFYANSTTGECFACEYPYSSPLTNSRSCTQCRRGFWVMDIANQAVFANQVSARIDHPISAQHRTAMNAYIATYRNMLNPPWTRVEQTRCLVCPPGFFCTNQKIHPADTAGSYYSILPGGSTGMNYTRRCPRIHTIETPTHRTVRALATIGGCFENAATWQM